MNEFEFKVPNWAKYNPRNDYKSMPWVRLQVNVWSDPRVERVTFTSKLTYVYLVTLRAACGSDVVQASIRSASFMLKSKANLIRCAVDELERNQLIEVVSRSWPVRDTFATKRNETKRTYETKRTKALLTTNVNGDKIVSESSQNLQKNSTKSETKTAATWESFSNAYRKRYGSEPVRNATTNSQMSNFVKRIGETESPEVAAFYVSLTDQFYLNQCHAVGILLRDSEKLRTMWANGIRNTKVDAKTAHWREQARLIETGEL